MKNVSEHHVAARAPVCEIEAERDRLRAALASARGAILDLRSHLADLSAAQSYLRLSHENAAAEVLRMREHAVAAEADQRVRESSMLVERQRLLDVQQGQSTRLEMLERALKNVAALTLERDALLHRADVLDRLVGSLRWEDGPKSLRAVLPLARLLRRMSGG
jgi:chromosome segregation ATPase